MLRFHNAQILTAAILYIFCFISVQFNVTIALFPGRSVNYAPSLNNPAVASKSNPPSLSSDAQEYLDAHNVFRQKLHLQPLQWDKDLATFAQSWALERIADCDPHHHSQGPYGENIFWELYDEKDPVEVVKVWTDEQRNYDHQKFACKCQQEDSSCMCGHYTQVVWYNTRRVGCANVTCNLDKGTYVVCSYDPPGNYPDQNPFGNLANGQSSSLSGDATRVSQPPPAPVAVARSIPTQPPQAPLAAPRSINAQSPPAPPAASSAVRVAGHHKTGGHHRHWARVRSARPHMSRGSRVASNGGHA